MARLIRDRFFDDGSARAFDLATGAPADPSSGDDRRQADGDSVPALADVLRSAQDGAPRWITVPAPPGTRELTVVNRAAAEGRAHGFVPIAVDLYFNLREALNDELRERALLLIAGARTSIERARAAFVDASARSSRPHVLLLLQGAAANRGGMVREARAVYGAQTVRPGRPIVVPHDLADHLQRRARARQFAAEGRHAAAERLYRDVAGAFARREALSEQAHTLVMLGRLLLERGRAAAAEKVFDDAARAALAAGDEGASAGARLWQAAARTDLLQLTAAEALCRALLAASSLAPAARVVANATLSRVLQWQGRLAEALELDLTLGDATALDPVMAAFVGGVDVRRLIEADRLFEAGMRLRTMTGVSSDDPLESAVVAMASLRLAAASGDLALAESRMQALDRAARAARSPLRGVRGRVLWIDTMRRAGLTTDAVREVTRLRHMSNVAPPLLRRAIEQRIRTDRASPRVACARSGTIHPGPSGMVDLIRLVQDVEDDESAARAVVERIGRDLRTVRVDVFSADAGPVASVLSNGNGLAGDAHLIGGRVLEAGITIGPEPRQAGYELGVPLRIGARLIAAIVGRWAADNAPPPAAVETFELAAAVLAPRVHAMLAAARHAAATATSIPELVGTSAAMGALRAAIGRAAGAPFAVLIEGESGVGKELVARAIHQLGPRRERRFCDLNCAALPDDLFESELFGHARGAFTGAVSDRPGIFEEADGGTLFLDELADLSPRAQAKLLRVLQQHEVRRLGESFSRPIDVRLVTAANRDMRGEAGAGRFRQDLLYRLDVIRIQIPPLRERPEDIPLLVEHFWRGAAPRVGTRAVLTHGVITALSRYPWPGNVRELQNAVAALAVAAPETGRVRSHLLPPALTGAAAVTSPHLSDARDQFERRFIEVALARAGGSRSRAAREIGLSRQGLLKMMLRLGLSSCG